MTSAYILIVAILFLGGLLAVLGDRLGSKIGKKRMRLFNLRPRQTATVITIVTGFLIAASTLAVLFSLSKSLRQGVFELDQILKERRTAIRNPQLRREYRHHSEFRDRRRRPRHDRWGTSWTLRSSASSCPPCPTTMTTRTEPDRGGRRRLNGTLTI